MNNLDTPTRLWSTTSLAKIALITALYVVISVFLAPFSFGPIQLRLAESFNYLAVFNKRYIVAVTLGVIITNFYSPLGLIDVFIGSFSTLIVLLLAYYVTKKQKSVSKKLILTALLCTVSMFTVAGELSYFYQLPFFYTWLTVALGELLSMSAGGIVMYKISKVIDLTK